MRVTRVRRTVPDYPRLWSIPFYLPLACLEDVLALVGQLLEPVHALYLVYKLQPVIGTQVDVGIRASDLERPLAQLWIYSDTSSAI